MAEDETKRVQTYCPEGGAKMRPDVGGPWVRAADVRALVPENYYPLVERHNALVERVYELERRMTFAAGKPIVDRVGLQETRAEQETRLAAELSREARRPVGVDLSYALEGDGTPKGPLLPKGHWFVSELRVRTMGRPDGDSVALLATALSWRELAELLGVDLEP